MEQIRGAIYDAPPDNVVFHITSVDVVLKAIPFYQTAGGSKAKKWLVDLDRYMPDEYYRIALMQQWEASLQVQEALTELYESSVNDSLDAQTAIAELYEMMIGGDE